MSEHLHPLARQTNELSSPIIRLLPSEIVSEIFTFCLPPLNREDNTLTENHPLPLRLGAVCSAWRRIAWSSPTLWATVQLHLTYIYKVPSQTLLLKDWLSRSGDLPLSICLSALGHFITRPEEAITIISEYAHRWRHINLNLPSASYAILASRTNGKKFPMLESVILDSTGGPYDSKKHINLVNSPRLTYLTLGIPYLKLFRFQWDNLTNLHLQTFYIGVAVAALRRTPRLVELNISKIFSSHPDDHYYTSTFELEPIHFPFLTRFSIVNTDFTNMGPLLCKITAPALVRLSYFDKYFISAGTSLVDFLTRSRCALNNLSLSSSYLNESDLLCLLNAVPLVKRLSLYMPELDGEYAAFNEFTLLTDTVLQECNVTHARKIQATCLVPYLEVLTYTGVLSFSWALLIDMIHSRTRTSTPDNVGRLLEVYLHLRLSSEAQVADIELEEGIHQERGVKLSLALNILPLPTYD